MTSTADEGQHAAEPSKNGRAHSLFVRSLPASVTTERLTELFSQSYPVRHATVVVDRQTKISKGFGFVTFVDAEDADAAIEQFNNSTVDGRKIKVEFAEARHRDVEDGGKRGQNTTAVQLRAEREEAKQKAQPPKLIVRNLPWSIQEPEDLAALFQSYGKVKHAVVPRRGPKALYGFGIVVLRGKKNAEKAIAGVNGKEVDGRTLAVDWAVDKKTWEEVQPGAAQVEEQADKAVPADAVAQDQDAETEASKAEDVESGASGAASELQDPEESSTDDIEEEDDDDDGGDDIFSQSDLDSVEPRGRDSHHDTRNDTTVFIRNLPYSTDDEMLKEHFQSFGPVRYARVVYDPETDRSKGTGFVCFFKEDDAKACVKDAPKDALPPAVGPGTDKKRRAETVTHSVLQNEASDPSGRYTLDGRVLQVSRALSKSDAEHRASEASAKRDIRDRDKRRLYLLSEGTISQSSKLYTQLGKAESDIRESSAKQRQKLIKSNANLGLSLTRLSIRNIPRSIGSKELKALAREAVVGFAKDVKAGIRQPLSQEELARGGAAMREAERRRKQKGVGIVKQAKIVFEGREGSKVKEGGGRSRGYGFIEYFNHRNALAGLRWLNGHMVNGQGPSGEKGKRLIVEFAIENAQVVQRRNEREHKASHGGSKTRDRKQDAAEIVGGKKRQRDDRDQAEAPEEQREGGEDTPAVDPDDRNRMAKRNRIIAKKRHARRARKG